MSIDAEDLQRRIQEYGLDEVEAQLYYHLSRLGPSRAATVADAAGRKRTDVYRVLDNLVDKGFAQKTLERPALYVPHPLEEAVRHALDLRRAQISALESKRADLAQAWPRHVAESAPTRARFTVHQGAAQVVGLLERMIASAREEIVLAASPDGLARLDTEALRRALETRAAEGLLVRILAKRARSGTHPLAATFGARVRHADTPTFYQVVAVDDREVAIFVATGKGRADGGLEESVLWLSSPDVVLAQKALFDQAWAVGIPARELGAQRPRQLEVLRGRWVRGARLREMADNARSSLLVTAPPSETRTWLRDGVTAALQRAAARGVHVAVRSADGGGVPGHVPDPMAADGCNLVAVADGVETLLSLGLADGDDDADEWALWSTHADLVTLLALAGAAPAQAVRPAPTAEA